jgi:hypothetical protein
VVIAAFMIYGIRDVASIKDPTPGYNISKSEKLMASLHQFKDQVKAEKSIPVAMFANFVSMGLVIATFQFGFLIYAIEYDQAYSTYQSIKLAGINLIGNLVYIPLNILVASWVQRGVKVWKLLLISAVLSLICSSAFAYASWQIPASSLVAG